MALNTTIIMERLKETFGNESQTTTGNKIHLVQGSVSKILSGKQPLSVDTLIQVAEVYGVSADWLIGMSEKKYRSNSTSYTSATLMMIELIKRGAISIENKQDRKLKIQINDPIINALTQKGLKLYETDRELYFEWIDSKLSMLGEKSVLTDAAWTDYNVNFLASQAATESNWLEVYDAADRIETEYEELAGENPGPFGE